MERIRRTRRTRQIRFYTSNLGDIHLLPVIHYEHWASPLYIDIMWLWFTVHYSSVIRLNIEQFKQVLRKMRKR